MTVGGLDVRVRPWEVRDWCDLVSMVWDCLRINYEAGADMEATLKNAEALTRMGLEASKKGEPCLLVELAGCGPIGYTEWCELPNALGLDFRGRVLHGLGTYVKPAYQKQGVSTHLRNCAEARAKRLGFTKIVGVAYHDAGLQSVLARNYRVVGTHVEKVIE